MARSRSRRRRALGMCIALTLLVAMMPIAPAAAGWPAALYVDAVNGDDTTGDGSAADPYQSITHAMTQAGSGTTIYVQPGVYDTSIEASFPILVTPGVFVLSLEGPEATTIDAEGTGNVIEFNDPTVGTGIAGFTVENGYTVSASAGIGIWQHLPTLAEQGWPLIEDCNIRDNEAVGPGGGMMVWGSGAASVATPLIVGCDISGNIAGSPSSGGGIYAGEYGAPRIWECDVYANSAGYGGGIYADSAIVQRCDIRGNDAEFDGAGLALQEGSEVRDCWIVGNASGGYGGGIQIYCENGDVLVERTTIEGNFAADGGGVAVMAGPPSQTWFDNVVVADNSCTGQGGAAYIEASGTGPETAFNGCTVVGNTGAGWDGIDIDGTMHATITSSIIDHGTGDIDDAEDVTGSHTISYSLTHHTALSGTGVIHGDPQFIDPDNGDYELALGSPCIDTGNPSSALIDDVLDRQRPEDGDANGSARCDMGAYERPLPDAARIAGGNRFETAGIMAQWREWPGTTAVLASGMGFADALSGSGLAGAYQGPLLITAKDNCPGIVFDALEDAGISDVVIVGGTAAVSDAVKTQLQAEGYGVTRVWGSNRYATAAAVAEEIAAIEGPGFFGTAFLARGDDFADALAASPIAYAHAMPVLLTATNALPAATEAAITGLGMKDVVVVGGTSAVSRGVKDAVEALPGVDTYRVAAANRYATAAAVADYAVNLGWARWTQVGIATGTNYPDALAGGALCGARGGVLLLTQPAALPAATRDALAANKRGVIYCEVYGGKLAVTDAVKAAINTALGW